MSAQGWNDGDDADLFADVAGKVRGAWMAVDDRLAAALGAIRERSERPLSHVGSLPISHDGVRGLMESAGDVPALLAAINKALELTDPLRNPTLGGTFLGAVGVQVREAILAELEAAPVGQGGTR